MKILSMTATFGKLQNAVLELKPGLNVIHAPNEWGKSTWCAFLVNMLYGIDTRERTTATSVADKDRYAPWSGAPMAGTMRILWEDRDITLERTTKGRIPMGNFRAYETETGIEVPELTAANCGQILLGVERSVFTRAGFLRLADLPVTQDDALRRRLNALVTTGDESGSGDRLEQSLRDLKNKCQHNQTGLIPQVEAEQNRLRLQLEQVRDLQQKTKQNTEKITQLEEYLEDLTNHRTALQYEAARTRTERAQQMAREMEMAQLRCEELESRCSQLPELTEANARLETLGALEERQKRLQLERSLLPQPPEQPVCTGPEDPQQAAKDATEVKKLRTQAQSKRKLGLILCAAFVLAAVAVGVSLPVYLAVIPLALAVAGYFVMTAGAKTLEDRSKTIEAGYPGLSPDSWESSARSNQAIRQSSAQALENYQKTAGDLDRREKELSVAIAQAADGDLQGAMTRMHQALECRQQWQAAQKELEQLQRHQKDLEEVSQDTPAPAYPDRMTFSREETLQEISETQNRLQQLRVDIGRCQGKMENLGEEAVIRARLDTVSRRLTRLTEYNAALEMALDALYKAKTGLQRRFAPQLVKQTEEIFSRLTQGRYSRVSMAEDLSLRTAAEGEVALEPIRLRSDGTVDQLYLALRLAVAAELTPQAPLVLDDVLVRFDEERSQRAMEVLEELAQTKQVVLFTCRALANEL